jgi:lipopolysaccharide exporter
MKALIRRVFTRGTFAANVATLGAGSFVGQIATILASPILSRLFLPEAFGELQYLLSLGLILGAISTLRYEMAIPLASHRSDAKQLLVLSSGLAVILALIVSIILLVSPDSLTHFRGSLTTPVLIYFLPLLLLMEAHNSIFSYWFTRTKNYKIPSLAKTLFGGGTALGQLGLAVSGFISGLGLILGYLLGQGASLVSFLIAFFRERPEQHEERVSFSGILRQARLHIKFPLFSSWNVVLNTVARNMPPLLLVSYFGMAEAGFYAIGIRLLNMPLNTLGMSVGQVYYQQIARYKEQRIPMMPLMRSAIFKLAGIIFLPLLIIALFGEQLFSIAFGEAWSTAGRIAALMVPFYFMRFIASPISSIFAVLGKQHIGLLWQAAYTLGTFASFYFTRGMHHFEYSIKMYSWMGAALFLILLIMTIFNTRRSDLSIDTTIKTA